MFWKKKVIWDNGICTVFNSLTDIEGEWGENNTGRIFSGLQQLVDTIIFGLTNLMYMCTFFSTCSNGTFACGKESCEEQIVCPKNQVYRKGVTACRKTCELYGREMICDSDVLMDGCVCDESNNQTAYMAPDVRYNSPNTPQKPSKNTPTTEKKTKKYKTKTTQKQKQHPPPKKKNNKKENYKRYSWRPKIGPDSQNSHPFPNSPKNWKKWRKSKTKILIHYCITYEK